MRGETITATTPASPLVPAQYDAQGNPVLGTPATSTIPGCALAPIGEGETAEPFGPVTVRGFHVYVKDSTVSIDPAATFTIRGVAGWQMDGLVGQWVSPFSTRGKGVEFTVRRAS